MATAKEPKTGQQAPDPDVNQAQDPEPAAPAPKPAAPAKQQAAAPPKAMQIVRESKGRTDKAAVELLLSACDVYGINPDGELPEFIAGRSRGDGPFRELLAWTFYPSDGGGIPDMVALVTAGGVKIKHYADPDYGMDQDTEDTLRKLFHAFTVDKKTKEIVNMPLPADLTLPAEAVTGRPTSTDHVYQRGYLREGGKTEAARRAAARRGQ